MVVKLRGEILQIKNMVIKQIFDVIPIKGIPPLF